MHNFDVTGYLYRDGSIMNVTPFGCYPLFYLHSDYSVLCYKCADKEKTDLIGADCNYEDPDLYCDECSERIESAYAEDEVNANA